MRGADIEDFDDTGGYRKKCEQNFIRNAPSLRLGAADSTAPRIPPAHSCGDVGSMGCWVEVSMGWWVVAAMNEYIHFSSNAVGVTIADFSRGVAIADFAVML